MVVTSEPSLTDTDHLLRNAGLGRQYLASAERQAENLADPLDDAALHPDEGDCKYTIISFIYHMSHSF